MDFLQNLLDSGTTPLLTATLLGLITALSPCPLATNIAAIGYIGRDIESRNRIFVNGMLYTLGRVIAYTVLGIVLITILRQGASIFGIQRFIARYGEMLLGPTLILLGAFMLVGDLLPMPSFGYTGTGERVAKRGALGALVIGILFALAFCPTSGVFYFGMLIPLSASTAGGYLLPVAFAIATAIPVIVVAWVLAFSAKKIGELYKTLNAVQRWLKICAGVLFLGIGIYYIVNILL